MRGASDNVHPIHPRNGTTTKWPLRNGTMLFSKLLLSAASDRTYEILVGVHVDFETVFFAFAEDFDSVVHEFVVIFTTTFRSQRQQPFAIWFKYPTYGPSCSRASQVTGKCTMLNPHPLSLAKCTSASSRSKGLPIKLFPPFSAVSQNPSSF